MSLRNWKFELSVTYFTFVKRQDLFLFYYPKFPMNHCHHYEFCENNQNLFSIWKANQKLFFSGLNSKRNYGNQYFSKKRGTKYLLKDKSSCGENFHTGV